MCGFQRLDWVKARFIPGLRVFFAGLVRVSGRGKDRNEYCAMRLEDASRSWMLLDEALMGRFVEAIRVELLPRGPVVQCRVEGNWTTAEEIRLGRASTTVEALVASLDGTINQYFGPRAAVSNLIFSLFARAENNEPATSGAPKALSPNLLSG